MKSFMVIRSEEERNSKAHDVFATIAPLDIELPLGQYRQADGGDIATLVDCGLPLDFTARSHYAVVLPSYWIARTSLPAGSIWTFGDDDPFLYRCTACLRDPPALSLNEWRQVALTSNACPAGWIKMRRDYTDITLMFVDAHDVSRIRELWIGGCIRLNINRITIR